MLENLGIFFREPALYYALMLDLGFPNPNSERIFV